jgi:hypothetical protein
METKRTVSDTVAATPAANPSMPSNRFIPFVRPAEQDSLTARRQVHILNKNVKDISSVMLHRTGLKDRLFFTSNQVAAATGTTFPSAQVLCSRAVKRGDLIRLKKDFYVLAQRWEQYGDPERLVLANFLQTPSYISLMTALSFRGLSTQVQRTWVESMAQRRTVTITAGDVAFLYHKIAPRYYTGFNREDGCFIATAEKALLDAAYLESLGRYSLDWDALDLSRLDRGRLLKLLALFPGRIAAGIRRRCGL